MTHPPRLGLVLGSSQPPDKLLAAARAAEEAGFDELWVGEDYFFTGAIAAAAALLARTELPVGIGIAPAVTRHPALLAMELATLAGMFPGRVHPGVGAGVPDWLDQMALRPRSPLGSVRHTLRAVRALLDGETLDVEHETFAARAVALHHPPAVAPPLYAGVSGPKALAMAGAEADGTVLSVLAGEPYVRWARERLAEGGAGDDHRVVLFALCAVDDDPTAARERLRELVGLYLLTGPRNALTEVQGIADEAERLAALGLAEGTARIPEDWIDRFAIAGPADQCAARVQSLGAAGADVVALCFAPEEPVERTMPAIADALAVVA